VLGFLVGEKVEGSSFLFDASIKGPAITHLTQVPAPFWGVLAIGIARSARPCPIRMGAPRDALLDSLLRADVPGDVVSTP
jgi:hypothetical protein